jgi:hypothetical protein
MAVAIFEPQAKSWAFSIAKISWKRGMSAESMPIWKVPPWMRTIESSVFVDGVSVEGVDAAGVVCAWAQQVEEKQNSKARYAVVILNMSIFQAIDERDREPVRTGLLIWFCR